MNKQSVLYIDLFVPHPLFLYKPKNSKLNILNFKDTQLNDIVDVFEQLREIRTFDSTAELQQQLEFDVQQAAQLQGE